MSELKYVRNKNFKGPYYYQQLDDLLREFNTELDNGLKSSELENRYQNYGYNELPKIKKSIWKIYFAPIFNFLILILLVTGIIVVILGSPGETIITFTVVFINSATVIIQQYRAQKALESLRQISALKATVLRDGVQYEIPNRNLVPGDIVILNQGDKIPADGRILNQVNLAIDEAPLTGESEPVEKNTKILSKNDVPLQKQSNMMFMGTYVHTGRATALITGTGVNTEIGKISVTINEMGSIEEIPLTRKLNRLGYILGIIVIINLIILISYKFIILAYEGNLIQSEVSSALVSSILRATNILPINLPLLSTLVLITGVLSMAQHGVIIKNLSAIESLGRVSVICSDKTGTITKNEMTVEKFWISKKEYEVSGSGYDAEGDITFNTEIINLNDDPTFQKFIDSLVLNNNAQLIFEDVKVRVADKKEMAIRRALGSPTEAALLVLSEKAGFIPYDVKKKYNLLTEFSFSSELKRMSSIYELKENKKQIFLFSKGAPENIITICSQSEIDGVITKFDNNNKTKILKEIRDRANQGYRTLAIAYKMVTGVSQPKREVIEDNLIFLGYVSIMDPPRNGVKQAVGECQSGQIQVIMITGDHPATAKTIATQMGIYNEGDLVAEGKQIKDFNHQEFKKISVFARVEPSDKEIIVNHYQNKNQVVAMTGDGINDSLALKLANVGIAMGITGTDVAKETADMVISDDNFTSIEKGVKIGRGLFSKIRVIIYFFICLNIMEAIIFFTYEFIPVFELFSSEWQHIYIFGIVHSLPSLALVIDSHPKDIMLEPPRDEEQILNKNMWIMLLIQAFLMGLGLVLALQLTLGGVIPLNEWNLNPNISYIVSKQELAQKARTMFITTLFIVETNFIWTFRRPNKSLYRSIKEEFNISLFIICLFTLGLHILFICFSYTVNYYINIVFGLDFQINFMFLSGSDWLICILLALPGIIGIEIFKHFTRQRKIHF
ncbi:MAG: cation-translocating P-type ATPase [Candidatus Lokiarchaeota archaeon]|nr:cation-translocating P-type ATPase [Candidatus Lokiarchaeota archaeon]